MIIFFYVSHITRHIFFFFNLFFSCHMLYYIHNNSLYKNNYIVCYIICVSFVALLFEISMICWNLLVLSAKKIIHNFLKYMYYTIQNFELKIPRKRTQSNSISIHHEVNYSIKLQK